MFRLLEASGPHLEEKFARRKREARYGLSVALLLPLLVACGGAQKAEAAAPSGGASHPFGEAASSALPTNEQSKEAETSPRENAGHLTIGPLTLRNERGFGLVLDPEGKVTRLPSGELVGRLGSDGQFFLASGKPGPKLEADGRVVSANGRHLPIAIGDDGTVRVENAPEVHFDEAGQLVGGNPDAPKTEVSGLSLSLRRAAGFLLILAAFPVNE